MKLRYFSLLAIFAIVALQFSVATAQITVFPSYTEDFESSNGGWSGSGTNATWAWGTPVGPTITTAYSGSRCWKTNLNGNYNNSETSYMTSPIFDFSCLTADPTLSFGIAHYIESGYDYCTVEFSTNGGSTWTTLGSTSSGGTNWYQTSTGWNGNRAWVLASHILTGLAGKSSVMIRFKFTSDSSVSYDGMGIDLVTINLAGATLSVPSLNAPADGATGVAISPTLSWNAVACASGYDIQVATDPTFTNLVTNVSGNLTTTLDIGPLAGSTLHYWRARATRGAIVGNWSAIRTFTTLFPPPPVPILSTPVNNATAQALTTILTWLPSVGAASYRVQVSTNPAFTTTIKDTSVAGTTITVQGLQNYTVYYWRVNATNVSGTSAYSAVWNFRTVIASTALTLPNNSDIEVALPANLSWVNIPGLAGYRVQVATDVLFTSVVYDNATITAATVGIPNLLNNTQYYWRVKCIGSGNEESNWTNSWSFRTIIGTPILLIPTDGALDQPLNTVSSWNPLTGQPSYQVQVATNVIFTTDAMVLDTTVASGTSASFSRLANNTLYYWRVRGLSSTSGKGGWAVVRSFTTIVSPTTLVAPTNQSKAQPIPLILQWTSVGAKAVYQVQVATDAAFKNIVVDQDKLGGTTVQYNEFNGLKNNTDYYWRVRPASSSTVEIPWSPTWMFTTIIGTPALTSPKKGEQNLTKAVNFSWGEVDGSSSCMLQVAKDNKFTDIVSEVTGLIGTSKTVQLETDTRYFWRMRATSINNGTGVWSEIWSFVTGTQAASIPVLNFPEDKAKNVVPNVTITWKDAQGAATYDLQISRTADFKNVLVNESGLMATSYKANGLASKETYFWRVQGVNSTGASGWSDPWSFTVVVAAPASATLLLPAKNAKNQFIASTQLKWADVTDAASYSVQLSETADFSTTVVDAKDILITSYSATKLKPLTEYFWHVKAVNAGGEGAWSETSNFTTESLEGVIEVPELGFSLTSYPNPMTTSVGTVELTIQQRANVRISVVSLLGVEAMEVLNGTFDAGTHKMQWNSTGLSAGMYFLKVETAGKVLSVPVTIVPSK
jgi:hypothetical protein